MAQPIVFHGSAKRAPANLERLEHAPTDHAEAVLSLYELLQLLHDRGILSLLRGLVGAGDELIHTISAAVDTPDSIRAIRNFLLLTKVFANIPPDILTSLIDSIHSGAKREKVHKAPGLLRLLWRVRSENSRHVASIAIDLLECLGKRLESPQ
jgi:uncharacterized protein YjgD (DUF1641 family)